ncbi:response regulator transcription factor [Falsigemmobacter faecalis]|uniref:DNA-binding response regulator n=1 Tax=Falsigemmobacter faecalis TaxID=2488730 RepID=A0A3P3DHQ8_9RHOB|nr:response regulator transcription factor [Falsigemmobacter faecalis]RRH73226.1 DNA-binding response regulator [Falsigemmobacter faecalis]
MSRPDPLRILCIEDEADFRTELVEELEALGYQAFGAESGEAGLAVLEALPPASVSCVICDVMLPGLSGLEMVSRLRAHPAVLKSAPVLLLTALVGREDMLSGLRAGADDYLLKPVDLTLLQVTLENRLQRLEDMRQAGAPAGLEVSPDVLRQLSRRETEVLALLGKGKRSGEIARDLTISEHTVRQYTKELYRKLRITSRVDAARIAIGLNLA